MPDAQTVAIGGYLDPDGGVEAGKVRVFEWDGATWAQVGGDLNGEFANDRSGFAGCMPDQQTLAIGAPLNDGSAMDAGHVRIFGDWSSVSVDDHVGSDAVRVFPNPVTDRLVLTGLPAASGVGEVIIRDALGRTMLISALSTVQAGDPSSYCFTVGHLVQGSYIMEVRFNGWYRALPFLRQ